LVIYAKCDASALDIILSEASAFVPTSITGALGQTSLASNIHLLNAAWNDLGSLTAKHTMNTTS
jgi:hypothetical protein